jgi:hypothetical protein
MLRQDPSKEMLDANIDLLNRMNSIIKDNQNQTTIEYISEKKILKISFPGGCIQIPCYPNLLEEYLQLQNALQEKKNIRTSDNTFIFQTDESNTTIIGQMVLTVNNRFLLPELDKLIHSIK